MKKYSFVFVLPCEILAKNAKEASEKLHDGLMGMIENDFFYVENRKLDNVEDVEEKTA
jgi:hypothetical protein